MERSAWCFLDLLAAALAERKIIVHSSDLSRIAPLVEALDALLYPLKWAHAFVPVLPRAMLEVAEAPQPYILGVHTDWLTPLMRVGASGGGDNGSGGSILEDVVLVDIDNGVVTCYDPATAAASAAATSNNTNNNDATGARASTAAAAAA